MAINLSCKLITHVDPTTQVRLTNVWICEETEFYVRLFCESEHMGEPLRLGQSGATKEAVNASFCRRSAGGGNAYIYTIVRAS